MLTPPPRPVFHGPSVLYGRWPACPNQRRHASPPTLLPPLPSTQMHPVIQNSRGRSSKEAQLTSQLVTLAPKERLSSCVLLQLLLLLRGASSPTTSRSHAVAAQGAPCTVGGVFLHACVSVLCVFFVSPLGCSHSSHEYLWGCALDSNHKKNE